MIEEITTNANNIFTNIYINILEFKKLPENYLIKEKDEIRNIKVVLKIHYLIDINDLSNKIDYIFKHRRW